MITSKMLSEQVGSLLESLRNSQKRNKCENFFSIIKTINMVLGVIRELLSRVEQLEKTLESYENQNYFINRQTGEIKPKQQTLNFEENEK